MFHSEIKKRKTDSNHKSIKTLYTNQMHISLVHFLRSLPPTYQQPRIPLRIYLDSQLELITKLCGMPTKPQEILTYLTTTFPLPFRQSNSLPCQDPSSVHLRTDNVCCGECETLCRCALGDMCPSHRFGIKDDLSGDG